MLIDKLELPAYIKPSKLFNSAEIISEIPSVIHDTASINPSDDTFDRSVWKCRIIEPIDGDIAVPMWVNLTKLEYDELLETRDIVDMRGTTLSELIVIQGLWRKNKRQQLLYT